jgi:plastocyanin
MSQEELVQRYLDGQMGRRVFLRRLVATGVSAAAALTYADILHAMPAGATAADFYVFVQDYSFTPQTARLKFGQNVEFGFSSANASPHSATDTSGMGFFDTGLVAPSAAAFVGFPVAGTYPYNCKDPQSAHTPMTGQIGVPLKVAPDDGRLGTTFTITWATSLPSGYVVDVQRRSPGANGFSSWKHGVQTKRATFTPQRKGTFTFRARLRKVSDGSHSGWSPSRSIDVT